MDCNILSETNGNSSILANTIFDNIANGDLRLTEELYARFKSPAFIKDFGNWQADYSREIPRISKSRLDDNGQPKLFKDDSVGEYYYLDKNNGKKYFPNPINPLESLLSNEDIKRVTDRLVADFFTPRLSDSLDGIDLNDANLVLSDFIRNKISEYSNNLREYGESNEDIDALESSMDLADTAAYIEFWENEVINAYKEIGLNYREDLTSDTIDEMAEDTREEQTFGKSSFEFSYKDNVSARIKLMLSTIPSDNIDSFFKDTGSFMHFDEVYKSMLDILGDTVQLDGEDVFDTHINKLKEAAREKPFLNKIVEKVERSNFDSAKEYSNFKAKFVRAFNIHKNNFYASYFKSEPAEDGVKVTYSVKNLSTIADKSRYSRQSWLDNFRLKFSNEGRYTGKEVSNIRKAVSDAGLANITVNKTVSENSANMLMVLDSLGIDITSEVLDRYTNGSESTIKNDDYKNSRLLRLKKSIQGLLKGLNSNMLDAQINPFDNETSLRDLSRDNSYFLTENADSSIWSAGKSKWLYSNPTYISNTIKTWSNVPNALKTHLLAGAFYESSYYGRALLGLFDADMNLLIEDLNNVDLDNMKGLSELSKRRFEEFRSIVFDSMQEEGNSQSINDAKDTNRNDFKADIINKTLLHKKKISTNPIMKSSVQGDKAREIQFTLPKEFAIDTNYRVVNGQGKINEKATAVIYNYVVAEYKRALEVLETVDNAGENLNELKQYFHVTKDNNGNWTVDKANGIKFQLFPSLNIENINPDLLGFNLYEGSSQKSLKRFLEFDNLFLTDPSELNRTKHSYKLFKYIEGKLVERIDQSLKDLVEAKVFDINDKGEYENKAIDSEIYNSYATEGKSSELVAKQIVSDVLINNMINQVEYSKLFSGDYAYYKNISDYFKRIQATYTDGIHLYGGNVRPTFNVAVMANVDIRTPYINELSKLVGKKVANKFNDIDSTDAQAWITIDRWKEIMEGVGAWDATYDSIWSKIQDPNAEFTNDELLKLAQPLKGVHFEVIGGTPVYLKYSQAVLTPQLIANNPQLKSIADAMKSQKIDELVTESGTKVGLGIPTTLHTEVGDVTSEDIKFNPITLSNSAYKIQQDLPSKNFKQTVLGSQIQANIQEGITANLESTFYPDGKKMTGKQLLQHVNNLFGRLSNKGLARFKESIGVDDNYNINNKDKLYDALYDQLVSRGAPDNVKKAIQARLALQAIPGFYERMNNIFASMAKSDIVQIKTNGGSFIQMANFGLSKSEATNQGTIWAPWSSNKVDEPRFEYEKSPEQYREEGIKESDWKVKYRDPNGETKYDTKSNIDKIDGAKAIIRPGGILISGSLLAKYAPNWRSLVDADGNTDKLFGTAENDYTDGFIDKKILDSIIGYRIPNQGLSSNDALQIVGILPETNGDTVVAYTGITTKTGSDFDIDKMYIAMPNMIPIRNSRNRLRQWAFDNFKGKTVEETAENIDSVLMQLENKADFELNSTELAEMLDGSASIKDINNQVLDRFVEAVLSNNNAIASRQIKEAVPDYNKVDKIIYDNNSVENELIQAYKAILLNPDAIKRTMQPIDYTFLKNDINYIKPDEEAGDMDSFDIFKLVDQRYGYLDGKIGVAMTANHVIDHNLGRSADMSIVVNEDLKLKLDNERSNPLDKQDLKLLLESNPDAISSGEVNSDGSVTISSTLSAVMNAFVDIAKDNYITRGNWNGLTGNVGLTMIRAGINPFIVNSFLAQPIITEYIKFTTANESIIGDNSGDIINKFKESLIENALKNYTISDGNKVVNLGDQFKKTPKAVLDGSIFKLLKFNQNEVNFKSYNNAVSIINHVRSEATLPIYKETLRSLRNSLNSKTTEFQQIQILNTFNYFQDIAKDLGNAIRASKQNVNAYGKNSIEMLASINSINEAFNSKEVEGFASKLIDSEGKPTSVYHHLYNSIIEVDKIMSANPTLFLESQNAIKNSFNFVSNLIYGENLTNTKLGDKLNKAFQTYVMSKFEPFNLDTEAKKDILLNTVDKFRDWKKNKSYDNLLLSELEIRQSDINIDGKKASFIAMNNRKKSSAYQNRLTNSWKDLMIIDPEFAEDLIKYSFITTGFQNSQNQFFSYIPYEYFAQNGINDYILDFSKKTIDLDYGGINIDSQFVDDFFTSNFEDSSIVPNAILSKDMRLFDKGLLLSNKLKRKYIKNPKPSKPYYKILNKKTGKFLLYKFAGFRFNRGTIIENFVLTSKRGISDKQGNRVYEYNSPTSLVNGNLSETIRNFNMENSDPTASANYFIELGGMIDPNLQEMLDNILINNTNKVLNELSSEEIKQQLEEGELSEEDVEKVFVGNDSESTYRLKTNEETSTSENISMENDNDLFLNKCE